MDKKISSLKDLTIKSVRKNNIEYEKEVIPEDCKDLIKNYNKIKIYKNKEDEKIRNNIIDMSDYHDYFSDDEERIRTYILCPYCNERTDNDACISYYVMKILSEDDFERGEVDVFKDEYCILYYCEKCKYYYCVHDKCFTHTEGTLMELMEFSNVYDIEPCSINIFNKETNNYKIKKTNEYQSNIAYHLTYINRPIFFDEEEFGFITGPGGGCNSYWYCTTCDEICEVWDK